MKKKRVRKSSPHGKVLRALMDEYAKETGKQAVNAYKVAQWALENGKYKPSPSDARKKLAREMSRAAREDYTEDENGKPVRVRHAYRVTLGDEQLTFWVKVEDATRNQMHLSAQQRRRGILKDCEQLDRDVTHYNEKYNPGESIQLTFDFTEDMVEKDESTEYVDAPPAEEIDGDGEPNAS